MSDVDHARFSRAFESLVQEIGAATAKYNGEVLRSLNGRELQELVRWISLHRPPLRPCVIAVATTLQSWVTESKAAIAKGNAGAGGPNGTTRASTSSALSSCDSEVHSNSGDSMTVLDDMIGKMEHESGQSLMNVFDDGCSADEQVPLRVPLALADQQAHMERERSDAWDKNYYTLQNALIKYSGIDNLYDAGQNKRLSAKEEEHILKLLAWSQQQRELREAGDLPVDRIRRLDSLCTRKLWSWDRDVQQQQESGGGVRRSASSPHTGAAKASVPTQSAQAAEHSSDPPLRDLDNRAPFPAAQPSAQEMAARKAANKLITRRATTYITKVKGRSAQHRKQDNEWLKYFQLLCDYDVVNGTFQVPENTMVRDSKGNICQLGMWLAAQYASLREYELDYPVYYAALADVFATGRLKPPEDSKAPSPTGEASSSSAIAQPAPRSTLNSSPSRQLSRTTTGNNADGQRHSSAAHASSRTSSPATHSPGLEAIFAAAIGSGGDTAPSTPRGIKRKSPDGSPRVPSASQAAPQQHKKRAAAEESDRAYVMSTGTVDSDSTSDTETSHSPPPRSAPAANLNTATHSDARNGSTATHQLAQPATTVAPGAGVSLKSKHLFQSRSDGSLLEAEVSLPMPSLAGSKAKGTAAFTSIAAAAPAAVPTMQQSGVPAARGSLSVNGEADHTAAAKVTPAAKRSRSPLASTADGSFSTTGLLNSTTSHNMANASVNGTAVHTTAGGPAPAHHSSIRNPLPFEATVAPTSYAMRPVAVRLLNDSFAAFVYGKDGHRKFGIGRVLTAATAAPNGTTKVQLLTPRDRSDPVNSRYRADDSADVIMDMPDLIFNSLRMDEGKTTTKPTACVVCSLDQVPCSAAVT
jgi:hypothetical protein